MRKSLLKLLGAVVALMLSTSVYSVGMGGINVTSALGQPLKAEIDLVAISRSEKDSLVARLASPDAYKSAGLEYPYGNIFKFKIENRADGQPYISASSAQPVNDPFVSLLVELTWSAGKLSREYTFLLDPPGYVAQQPAKAQVQPVAPEVQSVAPAAAGIHDDTLVESLVATEDAVDDSRKVTLRFFRESGYRSEVHRFIVCIVRTARCDMCPCQQVRHP